MDKKIVEIKKNGYKFVSQMLTGKLPKSKSWDSHVRPCKHRCLSLQG